MGSGDRIDAIDLDKTQSLDEVRQTFVRQFWRGRSRKLLTLKKKQSCLLVCECEWWCQNGALFNYGKQTMSFVR